MKRASDPWSSSLLHRRARPELPRRRRVGLVLLAVLAATGLGVAKLVAGSADGATALAAAGGLLVFAALALAAQWPLYAALAKSQLSRSGGREHDAEAIVVRTTADFSTYPPGELSLWLAYSRPWISYQHLSVDESGFTLRTLQRHGWSAGAKLRFAAVETTDERRGRVRSR